MFTYHTVYEDYTHYLTHIQALDRRAKSFVRTFSKSVVILWNRCLYQHKKKELQSKYSVHKDISVVPTGIDLGKFEPDNYTKEEVDRLKEKYEIKEDEKVLLYLGRVSQEKNLQEVIRAMPEYMNLRPNVKFVIVGSGPDKEKLRIGERIPYFGSCYFHGSTTGYYWSLL